MRKTQAFKTESHACGHTIHTHLLYIWVGQETTQTYIAHLRPAHSQAGKRDPPPWAIAGRIEDLSMAGSHVRGKKQTGQTKRTGKKNRHTHFQLPDHWQNLGCQ